VSPVGVRPGRLAAKLSGIKPALGIKGCYRDAPPADEVDGYALREPAVAFRPYSGHEMGALSPENTVFWEQTWVESAGA
jgi:hypothetical protein